MGRDPSELGTSPQASQNLRSRAKVQFKAKAYPTSKLQQKCKDSEPLETNPSQPAVDNHRGVFLPWKMPPAWTGSFLFAVRVRRPGQISPEGLGQTPVGGCSPWHPEHIQLTWRTEGAQSELLDAEIPTAQMFLWAQTNQPKLAHEQHVHFHRKNTNIPI